MILYLYSHIIKGRVCAGAELERALHDLHCIDYRDMYCEELREPVKYLKETKEGETFMLDFFEQEIQKAKEEAMKEAEAKIREIEKARKEAEKQAKQAQKAEEKARKQAEKQAKQAQKQGKLEGMAEAVINNIRSLMETMNITAENAMNALKIPQEKHEFYLAQL